jgi:alpha-tubulin suppressor-like RCC1 family protein
MWPRIVRYRRALVSLAAIATCASCGGRAARDAVTDAGTNRDAASATPNDGASDAEAGPPTVNSAHSRLACTVSSTCFALDDGSVRCWGTGYEGQLGDGLAENTPKPPTAVSGLADSSGLVGADFQVCSFDATDTAQCWGALLMLTENIDTLAVSGPTLLSVPGLANVAFGGHACAVTRAGAVYCWGPDEFLGNGSGASATPVQVTGIHDAIDVAVNSDAELGSGVATLVVLADGSVLGWGHGHGPGLITPDNADQLTPIPMPGIDNVRRITLGRSHACALLADGHVACWGENSSGQLGSPYLSEISTTPENVTGLDDVAEVHAAGSFTCARRVNGEIWCWGENESSELARLESTPFSRVPLLVPLWPATDLAVGEEHACARTTDGTVYCWGGNYSQAVVPGSPNAFPDPVPVTL